MLKKLQVWTIELSADLSQALNLDNFKAIVNVFRAFLNLK